MTVTSEYGSSGFITTDNMITVTFTSSEVTENFDASDVTCVGGEISDFSGSGTTYTAKFKATSDGDVSVTVALGVFTDLAGNLNGSPWHLVLRHDSRTGYFSKDNVRLIFSPTHSKILEYHRSNTSLKQQDWAEAKRSNPTDPTSGKYSILDEVETIGKQSDGTYVIFERKVREHHS